MPLHQAGIEKQILRVFYVRHQKDGLGDNAESSCYMDFSLKKKLWSQQKSTERKKQQELAGRKVTCAKSPPSIEVPENKIVQMGLGPTLHMTLHAEFVTRTGEILLTPGHLTLPLIMIPVQTILKELVCLCQMLCTAMSPQQELRWEVLRVFTFSNDTSTFNLDILEKQPIMHLFRIYPALPERLNKSPSMMRLSVL